MRRNSIPFALPLLAGAMLVLPVSLASYQPAQAVSVQNQLQPIVPQDNYPKFDERYQNMPGTNFRAARPEEYPRIFGGDCNLWRHGRTLYRCEDFYPRKRRNPTER